MRKPIVVGFDFDGVIAYNPARLARLPISFVKRYIFGIQKVSFFVPQTPFEKVLWSLAHETSVFPAQGATLLRALTKEKYIEAHLVTGRFGFLEKQLLNFLDRWDLRSCFTSITVNKHNEQPHVFKERVVINNHFDYFIEDNWDIVEYLRHKKIFTKVHWIYNIVDRGRAYKDKYPYLLKSLERIMALEKIKA